MTTLFPLPCPTLPEFSSLLIAGPLHPSAPIHLCLTHLASRPEKQAVFLTPSRQNFLKALQTFNDDWLNECGGYGAVSSVLSRITALCEVKSSKDRLTDARLDRYPPTPLHFSVILSLLKVTEPHDDPRFGDKLSLTEPPALLFIHDISSYFFHNSTPKKYEHIVY
jgi:hypothetical protein